MAVKVPRKPANRGSSKARGSHKMEKQVPEAGKSGDGQNIAKPTERIETKDFCLDSLPQLSTGDHNNAD